MIIKAKKLTGLQKSKGLIGSKKPKAIYFQTRFGVHTFGLKFPIDVVILDKNEQVVSYVQELKPNRIFLWNPKHNRVLELPKGTIAKKRIKQGDLIQLAS